MFFLLSSVQYLGMQVDCFGVACNTLHYFAPRVRALLRGLAGNGPGPPPPRFVSLPDVACAHLRALRRRRRRGEAGGEGGGAAGATGKAGGKVVLLGSRQTMDTAPRAEGGLSSHVLK